MKSGTGASAGRAGQLMTTTWPSPHQKHVRFINQIEVLPAMLLFIFICNIFDSRSFILSFISYIYVINQSFKFYNGLFSS